MSKKVTTIISAILVFISLAIFGWYCWIEKFGEEKVISNTYELGLQGIETADGLQVEPIFEVSYWKNANNLGSEVLEIKVNSVFDEDMDKYYYQAIQFNLSQSPSGTVKPFYNYTTQVEKDKGFWKTDLEYQKVVTDNYSDVNEYMSDDDWNTSFGSTYSFDNYEILKVESNGNLFGIKMKGLDNDLVKITKTDNTFGWTTTKTTYTKMDWTYFFSLIYGMVEGLPGGTDEYMTAKFGDIFTILKYDENKKDYTELTEDYNFDNLIRKDNTTMITMKVNVYSDGLNSSSNSSIGWYQNSKTYNVSAEQNGYFVGRDIIDVTLNDFDLIVNSDTNVATIKLNENFVNYYSAYTDKIYLNILIDRDLITENGYTFDGVTGSELDKFEIKSFKIQYTENDELKVVDYEF